VLPAAKILPTPMCLLYIVIVVIITRLKSLVIHFATSEERAKSCDVGIVGFWNASTQTDREAHRLHGWKIVVIWVLRAANNRTTPSPIISCIARIVDAAGHSKPTVIVDPCLHFIREVPRLN